MDLFKNAEVIFKILKIKTHSTQYFKYRNCKRLLILRCRRRFPTMADNPTR